MSVRDILTAKGLQRLLYPYGRLKRPVNPDSRLPLIPPLPKLVYTYHLNNSYVVTANTTRLTQLARICRTLTLFGDNPQQAVLNTALDCIRAAQALTPTHSIPVGVSFVFKPWRATGGAFPAPLPPTHVGTEEAAEVARIENAMNSFKSWLATYNSTNGTSIAVNGVILEHERFVASNPYDAVWDEAIKDKLNLSFASSKTIFPGVRVEWYVTTLADVFGSASHRPDHDVSSVAIYYPTEINTIRTRHTNGLAQMLTDGKAKLTPWISLDLAYSYRNDGSVFVHTQNIGGQTVYWPDYNRTYSFQWGARLLNPACPDDPTSFRTTGDRIVIYPQISDPAATRWLDHFTEFCHGAFYHF